MLMPIFGLFEVEPLGAQPLFNIGPLAITNRPGQRLMA
jgi:hypothetical protein